MPSLKKRIHLNKKYFSLGIIAWALCLLGYSQSVSKTFFLHQIENIKQDKSLNGTEKLKLLYGLKNDADKSAMPKDSVYAKILTAIASFELKVNNNYADAIIFTNRALQINISGKAATSRKDAVFSSLHLAYDYEALNVLNKAVDYYDTTFRLSSEFQELTDIFLYSKLQRAYLFFVMGDYQKCIQESYEGSKYALQKNDTGYYFSCLNQKAQSCYYLNQLNEALLDVEIILKHAPVSLYRFDVATALKTKALINEKYQNNTQAGLLFQKSIDIRMGTKRNDQIADDYNDFGNFYLNTMHDYYKANKCYANVIKYAQLENDSVSLSKGFTNISEVALNEKDYSKAVYFTVKAMQYLKLIHHENILVNPSLMQLNLNVNRDLIFVLMSNKTLLLFELYKKNKDLKYLDCSIETALLTDSIITQTRHEQYTEQSKLYWRNKTRVFFTSAMEACYLAGDAKRAFYFMEKSRAVLLNDNLNELGANAHLPDFDSKIDQDFKLRIAIQQQKLNDITDNTLQYDEKLSRLFRVKNEFEHFIKSLETKYPAYYAYKYEDKVPSLSDLQKYLAQNKQSFVHYFTNDTVAYILSITANNAKITKLSKSEFNYQHINDFTNFCSSKDLLNTNYSGFAALSNSLYKTLFQPLQLPKGRVIICSDNFLLPFDALCSDAAGKSFLINDYIFSYAYSATYLLKQFISYPAKGNFIGFAPVTFQPSMHVNPLINSAGALSKSAANYTSTSQFINEEATKNNFIKNIGSYTVANVFSHASADSSENEPRLYMHDTTINLSELQRLNRPATKLVVLSACQTNVGKNATGEGIYSLARGFTSAGIPSIAATLWKADEDMIYQISEKFNENLVQGMAKDSALQKAKIDFIKSNSKEKLLPYYWANMVLIGNTSPLQLTANTSMWWWIAAIITIFVTIIILKANKSSTAK